MKKFWYVSRDPSTVGYHDPKTAYFTRGEAEAFAEKMCRKTGHDFYVMESVLMVKQSKPPIEWVAVPDVPNVAVKKEQPRDSSGRWVASYDNLDVYDC